MYIIIKILKLAICVGHSVPFDVGEAGIRSEDQLNLEVGVRLESYRQYYFTING